MLSRPDFMSKQVIFIESSKSKKLKFKNSNLILMNEKNKILLQNPCSKIFLVFICGECSITSVLIKNAMKYSISIIFLNYSLKEYFSINAKNKGNFLLRKKQYFSLNNLNIAKHIVSNKINNQKTLMNRLRYKTVREKKNIQTMKKLMKQIQNQKDSQKLLGIEGSASKIFFKTYFKNMNFGGRKPRCRTDILNVLLDIGYHYLFNFIDANLELYGFDTYYGVYHKLFFQRKSLVCDIIEPFRCIIEKRIRKSYNLKQINEKDFGYKNNQYFLKREYY